MNLNRLEDSLPSKGWDSLIFIMMKTNYSFVPVPTNLIYLLDNDCFKLMTILIQEESYWKAKGRLKNNGAFFKSMGEISDLLDFGNEKDARLTVEALYRRELIDVFCSDGSFQTAEFIIRWDVIQKVCEMDIIDIIKFEPRVKRLSRKEAITYVSAHKEKMAVDKGEPPKDSDMSTDNKADLSTSCTPTLDYSDNIESLDSIEKEDSNNEEIISYNTISSYFRELLGHMFDIDIEEDYYVPKPMVEFADYYFYEWSKGFRAIVSESPNKEESTDELINLLYQFFKDRPDEVKESIYGLVVYGLQGCSSLLKERTQRQQNPTPTQLMTQTTVSDSTSHLLESHMAS